MTPPWERAALVNAAMSLACDVRDIAPDELSKKLSRRHDLVDLLIATAAMVDIDRTTIDVLAWAERPVPAATIAKHGETCKRGHRRTMQSTEYDARGFMHCVRCKRITDQAAAARARAAAA